jgi:beta-xylosidase
MSQAFAALLIIGMVIALLGQPAIAQVDGTLNNPIVPGDHPDPTIVRFGNTYWTASTSGNWAPVFALYRSTDLHHWTAAGSIFPLAPAWARGSFWAPEMVVDHDRILVYYVGRKLGGPLCIAVATAASPSGPYVDHGPIMCQQDGSIDPSFVRDQSGQPFLIWKEDGNSQSKPTTIWAQPLTADLLHVTGDKAALLVNDPASWEGGVIEAPYIMQHEGHFYLFYAGNACCGVNCHYAEGVARADHLLGPWTRDPDNPIIRPNAMWRCPGHGTAVKTPAGKYFFIYHAYPTEGNVYLGRESVLDSITWTADGWPVINGGRGPGGHGPVAAESMQLSDSFEGSSLNPEWKWPVSHAPVFHVGSGRLTLVVPPDSNQAFIARSPLSAAYTAIVGVLPEDTASAGIAVIGDARSAVGLLCHAGHLELWQVDGNGRHTMWSGQASADKVLWLRVTTIRQEAEFSFSSDKKEWSPAGGSISLTGLPPWDQGLRVGLTIEGSSGTDASFVHFSLAGGSPKTER